jgi:hypothetical protein
MLAVAQGCSSCCNLPDWRSRAVRCLCMSVGSGLAQCVLLPSRFRAMADDPSFCGGARRCNYCDVSACS